jgi:hypothetical protein
MSHDELLDSVAVLALGSLPEAEAADVRAHMATCDECLREYRELRATADLVGYAAEATGAEPNDVRSARMRANVMRTVRNDVAAADGTASAVSTTRPAPAPPATSSGPAARPQRTPWLAYLAAAAALVFATLTAINNATLRSQNDSAQQQIAAGQQQVAQLQHALQDQTQSAADARAVLGATDARVAAMLAPGSKSFGVAQGQVIESNGRIFLALRTLPKLPPGKVFQAWTLAKGAKAVAPSVTFTPDEHGIAVIELPEPAANLAAVALSVEPAGGSKAPTSKPAFVRPLT